MQPLIPHPCPRGFNLQQLQPSSFRDQIKATQPSVLLYLPLSPPQLPLYSTLLTIYVTLLTISSVPRLNECLPDTPDPVLPAPGPYFLFTIISFSLCWLFSCCPPRHLGLPHLKHQLHWQPLQATNLMLWFINKLVHKLSTQTLNFLATTTQLPPLTHDYWNYSLSITHDFQ